MKSSTRAANSRKFTSWFYASLFLATFLFSSSAMAQVANVAAGFAGAEAGEWGGQNGAVIGMPDGTCAAMGAVGKVNLVSGFGFSIPGSATITTLTAYIKAGESTPQDVSAQLATNAAVDPPTPIGAVRMYPTAGTGNNCAGTQISALGTTLADWGNPALTPAIVNNPAFGMIFIKIQTSNVKFDSICMEIGYTTAAGPAVQESCTGVVPPSNTIRVIKAVEGAAPGTDWSFNGTAPLGAFTLPAGGGFQDFADLTDGTYTITETTKPGYIVTSECTLNDVVVATGNEQISVDVSGDGTFSCVFTNTSTTGSVTVIKDFSDDDPAAVNMTLTCTSGSITTNPLPASEGSPAVFEVTGFTAGATCTATEAATPGYAQDISDCQRAGISAVNGVCTMVNTLNAGQFAVIKDFSDNNPAPIDMTLTCTSGTIGPANPLPASEGSPALFTVTGALQGATCTATEAATPGYTQDISGCQAGGLLADGGSCTMVNTLNDFSFTVNKDFSDDATDSVDVTLTCSSGMITTNPLPASEASPAVFQITGALPDATCTATEAAIPGYSQDISGCQVGGLLADGGSCTMVYTLNDFSFTVNKDFSDDATDSVDVTLT
ncbi:MAG TPA: hypothetical protein VKN35_04385, partial [Xanthomonadales bacterium]|nr:hypothetical protein [Xanthomonadales bacterium]